MATSSSPHFDLSSMLNLQNDYASNLSNVAINADFNSSADNAIGQLNAKLGSLSTNIQGSQANAQSVIYKQKLINDILDKENQRLTDKKANIDTAMSGQRRMIALNNNYQKRYAAYTKMTIAFVIGLVLYIFMDRLMVMLPFIPPFIFYILIIVILGSIAIYIYVLWADIQRREKTEFDEIALPAPDLSGSPPSAAAEGAAAAPAAGTPGGALGGAPSCACSANQ